MYNNKGGNSVKLLKKSQALRIFAGSIRTTFPFSNFTFPNSIQLFIRTILCNMHIKYVRVTIQCTM